MPLEDFCESVVYIEGGLVVDFGVDRASVQLGRMVYALRIIVAALSGLGIRTFWDLQQNQVCHTDPAWQEKMIEMELRVSQIPQYRDIAFFHHLILEKLEPNK